MDMKSPTFGVGVVGAGRVFEQHARACVELGRRARLLAIADGDEAQLRTATSRHFVPFAHRDYRSLLDRQDIDVVSVCTPPASHERIVVDALEAGKFVMCEKPLAHSLDAADRIMAAARRYPGKLTTVFQFRYLPEVRRTRWLSDQGHLGRLLFGRFSRYARFEMSGKPAKPGKAPKPGKERADWWGRWGVAGGGVVMTQLIHDLDLMCHLFGRPTEVTAVMDTLKEPIESEDTCAATVRFESGALACCYGTMTAHRTASAFDVIGESASAHLPWAFECMDRKRREPSLREVLTMYPPYAESRANRGAVATLGERLRHLRIRAAPTVTAHTPYVADVLDAIADGRPVPVGPEEARASLDLCTAVYVSALTRRSVAVPIDSTSPYYAGLTTVDYDGRRQQGSQRSMTDRAHRPPPGLGR
jgi:UDP-N-acetyl-2-amino-2-deoxyglucuronate dehydrogenase